MVISISFCLKAKTQGIIKSLILTDEYIHLPPSMKINNPTLSKQALYLVSSHTLFQSILKTLLLSPYTDLQTEETVVERLTQSYSVREKQSWDLSLVFPSPSSQ